MSTDACCQSILMDGCPPLRHLLDTLNGKHDSNLALLFVIHHLLFPFHTSLSSLPTNIPSTSVVSLSSSYINDDARKCTCVVREGGCHLAISLAAVSLPHPTFRYCVHKGAEISICDLSDLNVEWTVIAIAVVQCSIGVMQASEALDAQHVVMLYG
jgi:hypothetical protein